MTQGRWAIGDVEVTAVLESDTAFSPEFLRQSVIPDATRERVAALSWLVPHWADGNGDLRFCTQTFVVRSAGKVILVDTCLGNDKVRKNPALHRLATPFIERLAAAGVTPECVDLVVCTHLHLDHVGWNTRLEGKRWVPTFPRARYLFSRREWDHWSARPGHAFVIDDSIAPLWDAGLVDLIDVEINRDHPITEDVSLVATPGHSPGHCSVRIDSQGQHALITGDLLHHPCQVAHPEWTGPADSDRAEARATRERALAWATRHDALVIGTHFTAPAAGRVRGRRFEGVLSG